MGDKSPKSKKKNAKQKKKAEQAKDAKVKAKQDKYVQGHCSGKKD